VEQRVGARTLEGEVGDAARERVQRAMDEVLQGLRTEGIVGPMVAEDPIKRDAFAELVELGAIGPLLDDATVSEVSAAGTHSLTCVRGGHRVSVDPAFTSADALRRAVGRLCRRANAPQAAGEGVVERQLPSGFRLTAITGDAVPDGALLKLERDQRIDTTLDDLVRAGTVSRGVATFLRQCVFARANILVVGSRDSRTSTLLCALAAAAPKRPVVAVRDQDTLGSAALKVTHVDARSAGPQLEAAIDMCARMPDTRLVVECLDARTANPTLAAIGAGADGVLAALPAATIRRGLAMLPTDIAVTRPGVAAETIRSWVASAFDLYVEVATLRDGRHRVLRVSEPTSVIDSEIQTQDIFTFLVERTATGGSVEGTFHATGTQPRILDDMLARGLQVDRGLFNRNSTRS
jgi:pilus assembly protein CpaF